MSFQERRRDVELVRRLIAVAIDQPPRDPRLPPPGETVQHARDRRGAATGTIGRYERLPMSG